MNTMWSNITKYAIMLSLSNTIIQCLQNGYYNNITDTWYIINHTVSHTVQMALESAGFLVLVPPILSASDHNT